MEQKLHKAQQYKKQNKLSQAINEYEQYFNNYEGTPSLFSSYAECLRKSGRTKKAIESLESANELFPNSEILLNEYYICLDSVWSWYRAVEVAEKLIKINPSNSEHYFKLGTAYSVLKKHNKALKQYKIGLEKRHDISFDELLIKIKKGISSQNYNEITSKYKHLGGKNNFGVIFHYYYEKMYITKIAKYKGVVKREELFYKKVQKDFPQLKNVSPSYIDSRIYNDLLYLTVEVVETSETDHTGPIDSVKVIECSKKISSIPYQEIIRKYPNPNYSLIYKNRPVRIVTFFTEIHKKNVNKTLFSSLQMMLQQNKYPPIIKDIFDYLESSIMEDKLYLFLDPEKHYSLLHGDFIPSNMKLDKLDNEVKLFDWATFKIGPHFLDILKYFSKSLTPYEDVKSLYLYNNTFNDKLSVLEKIFFLYAYIVLYFVTFIITKRVSEKNIEKYIFPALKDFEKSINEFKNNELFIKLKETEERANRLSIEKKKLRLENQRIENKLFNLEQSKSWKITAPFRKIIESIKNITFLR